MLKTLLFLSVVNAYIFIICSGVPRFESAVKKIWQGNAEFTQNFLNLKLNKSPESSFIASPFSVLLPLAQLALYATGKTHDQLTNVLKVDNKVEIQGGYREVLNIFKYPKNVNLSLAQRVYTNINTPLTKNFKSDTKKYFDAEAQSLDFNKNIEAAAIINEWVKNQTLGLIPQLIDPMNLDSFTTMVLVNAIYFKGDWENSFNPRDTEKKNFYLSPIDKVKVKMMHQENIFKYTENANLQIKALQLRYKDLAYSLLVILPTSETDYGLKNVAQKIKDPHVFNAIIDDMRYSDIEVSLPSIKTSTATKLEDILKGVNITELFNSDNLELSGILKNQQSMSISVAIQKAVVVINELGSEAAAANAIGFKGALPLPKPQYQTFNANRPFLYYILYEKNVLFCGTYIGD